MKYFPLILLGVLLNAIAQIFLKRGMTAVGHISLNASGLLEAFPRAATNFAVLGAVLLYVTSIFVWSMVLNKVEVSLAYPFLSIGYLVVLAYGYFWGGENVQPERLIGVLLICVGVVFLFRSA